MVGGWGGTLHLIFGESLPTDMSRRDDSIEQGGRTSSQEPDHIPSLRDGHLGTPLTEPEHFFIPRKMLWFI